MQNNLSKQERQRVSYHFGTEGQQHPLLQACSVIFTIRAGKLDGNKIKAEDVFRLVASMLDLLFSDSRIQTWTQQDIDDLWCEQTQMLLDWPDTTVNDRQLIVDTEFRIVRKLLCHHWDTYYSEWLYGLFSTTIDNESKDSSEDEQQRIQKRLLDFSDSLNNWINNDYNGHLSIEIEAVAKGQTAEVKPLKPHSGRKAKDLKSIIETFDYLPRIDDRGQRLQAFYQGLRGRFIDINTQQKDFIDLFQNTTTTHKIVWIQEIIKLKYLILRIEKYITCPKGLTIWQIVCAHFQIRSKRKETDDNMTNDSYVIEDLHTRQFTKAGKIPEAVEDLDRIIRILDPKINYDEVLQDYLDAQLEHDEIKDTEDALANGLNTDTGV